MTNKLSTITTMAVLLMMAGSFTSCDKKENEAREIPFTEVTLFETCWWIDTASEKVIIINCQEELKKHIECDENMSFPFIDFSKHTLLLISGMTPNQIIGTPNVQLMQYSQNNYELHVTIPLGIATIMEFWTLSILVEKIDARSNINVNVKHIW